MWASPPCPIPRADLREAGGAPAGRESSFQLHLGGAVRSRAALNSSSRRAGARGARDVPSLTKAVLLNTSAPFALETVSWEVWGPTTSVLSELWDAQNTQALPPLN